MMMMTSPRPLALGFTLTEALITCAVVALVSALGINSLNIANTMQRTQSRKAVQGALMEVQGALTQWRAEGNFMGAATTLSNGTTGLLDRLDAVPVTVGSVNTPVAGGSFDCAGAGSVCWRLKTGAMVYFTAPNAFGVATVRTVWVDPDGGLTDANNPSGLAAILQVNRVNNASPSVNLAAAGQPAYVTLDR
jgi:Tfp pilus assembly protein PilV